MRGRAWKDLEGTVPCEDGDPVARWDSAELVQCDVSRLTGGEEQPFPYTPDPEGRVVVLNEENGWRVRFRRTAEGKLEMVAPALDGGPS